MNKKQKDYLLFPLKELFLFFVIALFLIITAAFIIIFISGLIAFASWQLGSNPNPKVYEYIMIIFSLICLSIMFGKILYDFFKGIYAGYKELGDNK